MPNGWGQYSTPPIVTGVPTPLAEGTLPPFPDQDDLVDEDNKIGPSWRNWFARQRAWLSDRGAYKPTSYTLFSMGGAAAVSGTPIVQWYKQGNMVQVVVDVQFTGVTLAGGAITLRPLPFDPTPKVLSGGSTARPVFPISVIAYNGTYNSIPGYYYNNKLGSGATEITFLNIPSSTTFIWANGIYITDN